MYPLFSLPLFPIFLSYAIGLSTGLWTLPLPSGTTLFALLFLFGGWAYSMVMKKRKWGAWIALGVFFFLGLHSIQLYLNPIHSPSHLSHFIRKDPMAMEGVIDQIPERSQEGTQFVIRCEKMISSNRKIPIEGNLLLFLRGSAERFRIGDRLRFLCRLYPPRGFSNPGGFSYKRYLAFKRIHAIGFLYGEEGWVKIGEGFKHPILLWIEDWRDQIRDFLRKETDPRFSGIFEALVLGEQGNISDEVKEYFTATGVAHLLAISGDHLGIIAFLSFSLIFWVLKRSEFLLLTLSIKKWAAGLTIPFILLYTFIAGGGISVVRATIMVIVFFLSILFSRERNLLYTLMLAAFLILLVSPPSLFDISFQLSFLSVLSILYLVPNILQQFGQKEILPKPQTSWKDRLWQYLKISLLVTTVATIGTAPFVLLHFNRISPIGLITNILAIPWVGFLIVPISLIASLFSFFISPLATFLIHLNHFLTLALIEVLSLLSSFPLASIYLPTPSPLEIFLFYLLLFLSVHLRNQRFVQYLFVGILLVFALDFLYWNLKGSFQKELNLTFIDVGQGDSILIEFPKGKRMLIDGGGLYGEHVDIGKKVIAPFLWKKKIRRIDYLVLTHPDPDHLKGLPFIASHFSIGQFWENGLRVQSPYSQRLEEILSRKKIERHILNASMSPLEIDGVQLSILHPQAKKEPPREKWDSRFINNQSLVMKLQFKEIQVLLTGDIEEEAESQMLREGLSLKADILKIPHHGSLSSSSLPFLQRVQPIYAILSVSDRNRGRLPHPEVLKRYERLGIKVFRTDQQGAILLTTDGKKMKVESFLKTSDECGPKRSWIPHPSRGALFPLLPFRDRNRSDLLGAQKFLNFTDEGWRPTPSTHHLCQHPGI